MGLFPPHPSRREAKGFVRDHLILTLFHHLLKTETRSLASIGAAIVLLSLPLDLCFQQLVFFPDVWVESKAVATIPRATTYTPIDDGTFIQNGTLSQLRDPTMAAVVEPFFSSNGSVPDLDLYCPTSNCTWDPFETLAVCSACDSTVGQELEFGCVEGPADWLAQVSAYGGDINSFPNATQCGWFLNISSESRVLMSGYARDPVTLEPGEVLSTRLFNLVDVFTRAPYYGGSLRFKEVMNPILDFLVVATPGGAPAIYRNETPVAHECMLTWCTKTIKASSFWGELSQNTSYTFINNTKVPFPWTTVQEPDFTDFTYTSNITLKPKNQHSSQSSTSGKSSPELTFGLTNLTATSIIFMMDEVVPSMVTEEGVDANERFKYLLFDEPGARNRPIFLNPWLPPNNLSAHMEKIAVAMATVMRNTPGKDGSLDLIKGVSWNRKKLVQTRWPWVILPVVLVFLALFFLLSTVVVSTKERRKIGIWKTSAMAVLINGLGDEVQSSFGSNCSAGQARMKAKELKIQLVPG
jgi:hypothetical protein